MDGAARIWLDDPNPIFRMGLAASLRDSRFVVVGESSGFVPTPALDDIDVLVFDLGEHHEIASHLRWPPLSRRQRRSTRLVALVPGGDIEAAQRSQCTVLVRSELTPEGFRDCLASVVPEALAPGGSAGRPGVPGGRGVFPRQRRREPPGNAHSSPFRSIRAALADAGPGLRRLARHKGVLFVVTAALAAGAFGPSGRADGLSHPDGSVTPVAETTPVRSAGDAATDVAVWVNEANPPSSLVIGTDKRGGLETYDLSGKRVQRLSRPGGTAIDVDVRGGFPLGGRTVALVGAGGRAMSFFRVDPARRQLREVSARTVSRSGSDFGFCLYRSAVSGRFYAFLAEPGGDVTQFELSDQGGLVEVREVRRWPLGRPAYSCVADDETGRLFLSDPSGIWRYDAEPDASPLARQQVDKVGGDHLAASVGGLTVVTQPGQRGFLVASSRGDNSFAIYRRDGQHGWLGQREVVDGDAADGCSASHGIEAVAADLGPRFPAGLFVCQDGRNTAPGPAGNQNFKYVRLERFLDAGSLP